MKPWGVYLLGLLWAMSALAQEEAPGPDANAAEQQRIESARVQALAGFDAEDADCYQRFASSGCLKDVQSRRRAVLGVLRKQEALLHERELALQAAAQRQRTAQKAVERQQQEADLAADKGAQRAADKLQEQQEKKAAHAAQAQASASGSMAMPSPAGPTPADQASNRDSHARKLLDAEQKRQEIAKRLAEKKGKSAAPLPLPL
jgi:hypothetical protein